MYQHGDLPAQGQLRIHHAQKRHNCTNYKQHKQTEKYKKKRM